MTSEVMAVVHRPPYHRPMGTATVGVLLRDWRTRRHLSQLELAVTAGVSTRHLSWVETGRSRPSPELVLTLARTLDVPLREQNQLLLAAGHAPRHPHTPLDDAELAAVRRSVDTMLAAHQPFPAVAVDRRFDVVAANRTAELLLTSLPDHVRAPVPNLYRLVMHPEGLAAMSPNAAEWVPGWLRVLHRAVERTNDAGLVALEREVLGYPNVAGTRPAVAERPAILLLVRLTTPLGELALFTTMTTFGTAVDVTVEELTLELFWPADDDTAAILRTLA